MKEYFESYSNLAYNVAGFAALIFHQDIMFCLAMQTLGVGSFVYHFNKSPDRSHNVIWKFDWFAMALVNTVIAGIHFNNHFAWIALFVWLVLYGFLLMGRFHVFLDVSLTAVPSLVSIYMNRNLTTFLIIVGLFLISVWIRSKDPDPKQLHFHDSTAHSVWHFLSAFFLYDAVYLVYESGIIYL